MIAAPLLEALQSWEPTHLASLLSVLRGAGRAFAAALVVYIAGSITRGRFRSREAEISISFDRGE